MSIKIRLENDKNQARKNRDKISLDAITMVIDRIQKKEKDLLRDLSEEEVVQVVQSHLKALDESQEGFFKRGDHDKVGVIANEIELVKKYLPEQMSAEEITGLILAVIAIIFDNGETPNKGNVMKAIMPLVKGKADNKIVNQLVTNLLA